MFAPFAVEVERVLERLGLLRLEPAVAAAAPDPTSSPTARPASKMRVTGERSASRSLSATAIDSTSASEYTVSSRATLARSQWSAMTAWRPRSCTASTAAASSAASSRGSSRRWTPIRNPAVNASPP